MTEREIEKSVAEHASRNAELLNGIRRRGVDTRKTYPVEHHFWAPTQKNAALLAKKLYEQGYLVLVISPVDQEDGSNVEAGIQRTLEEAASPHITDALVRLAAEFECAYDGWGASV